MGRRRKSELPKAPVIDRSGPAKGKKKGGRGKFLRIGGDDSDVDDDIAPAKALAAAPAGDDAEMDLGVWEEGEEGEEMPEDDESSLDVLGDDDASDDDEDDSDDSDGFEAKARRFKEKMEQQQREAAMEAATSSRQRKAAVFRARTGEDDGLSDEEGEEAEDDDEAEDVEDGAVADAALTIQQRKDRIQEVNRALRDFKHQREGDHSRREYVAILREDYRTVYDYSDWLLRRLFDLFGPEDLYEFIEAMEKQRPLTIRTNTIKTTRRDLVQAMTGRGMSVQPCGAWTKVGLQVFHSDVAVGSTAEYLAGHYLVQSVASFLPVMALNPEENMRVLDMAAAPGGKTTHIAQMMKNTGTLFANDVSAERLLALRGNLLRLGITNTIVTNYNGVGFEKIMSNFDRVLLDAPCTGIGVISRDPKIKYTKKEKDVVICSQLQKKLLLSAVDSLKVGGFLVYSTCSILVEENEAAVDYVLKHRKVRIVDTKLPFGIPGFTKHRQHRFHPTVEMSRRFYPHQHNLDGFYVCKIEKVGSGVNTDSKWYKEPKAKKEEVHVPLESRPVPKPPKKTLRRAGKEEEPSLPPPTPPAAGGKKRRRSKDGAAPVVAEVPKSFKDAAEGKPAGGAKKAKKAKGAGDGSIPITVVSDTRKRKKNMGWLEKMRSSLAEKKAKRRAAAEASGEKRAAEAAPTTAPTPKRRRTASAKGRKAG